ncbi:MAG: 50S ribosomal protein L28 [Candidatus Nomurabacteria bacterium]|nr:50S ribosomal protein L28 [Candidatus Nomurabacteria bacterium]
MASKCDLTGKSKMFGHHISDSYRHTKRVFKPNLQKKTFVLNGKKVTMHLSTSAIRTLKKKGVF